MNARLVPGILREKIGKYRYKVIKNPKLFICLT